MLPEIYSTIEVCNNQNIPGTFILHKNLKYAVWDLEIGIKVRTKQNKNRQKTKQHMTDLKYSINKEMLDSL